MKLLHHMCLTYQSFYRHHIVQSETGVLRAHFRQELLHQLRSAVGQARGEVGPEGFGQLARDHLQGAHILQNSNFLRKTEGEGK